MKKLFRLMLGLATAFYICGTALAAEPDYKSGTPWPDTDLDGVVTEDMEASVKDNFALAVNKEAILSTKIPIGYSGGGTVTDLYLKQNEDLKRMFLGKPPVEHDQKLAYDLFGLMMDWESRNREGVQPLKKETDKIEAIRNIAELNTYFSKTPPEDYIAHLWESASSTDFSDSTRHILAIDGYPLILGDSAEYKKLTAHGAIKQKAFSGLAQKMLQKLGYTAKQSQQKIKNCFTFEKMMASAVYTSEERQKADFLNRIRKNRYSYDELEKMQGNIPVLGMLKNMGYPDAKEYLVVSPNFFKRLNELYKDENITMIKDCMIVRGALHSAFNLDRECYEWAYACSNEIKGAKGMLPDEDMFASEVANSLEWPTARLYSETYLKQSDKERISTLIDRIFGSYHDVINEADFLSDATKAKAIEKLDAIDKRVLFPDNWDSYECNELNFKSKAEGGILWQAKKNIAAYNIAKNVREYSQPVDKTKWCAAPHTVNCFYDPTTNAIHILGAFAQGNIYNSDMSDEELLGKLGYVIGHEISHAFDSSGAQFDKDGNMKNWWTKADYAAFRARNDKMIAYYNNMHPWKGQNFYGSIMTGEACADMAGVKAVLRVAAKKKDFDYDKFFRAYANGLLCKNTLERTYFCIKDVHPLNYLRINCTLQQYDEFLNFYGIKPGDGMYLAPEDRVAIW